MAKAFPLALCVLMSFAIGEGFKTKGAMEQIVEANMNPGEMNHFIEDVFFLYQYRPFSNNLNFRDRTFKLASWRRQSSLQSPRLLNRMMVDNLELSEAAEIKKKDITWS